MIAWGDGSCWSDVRIYETCCFLFHWPKWDSSAAQEKDGPNFCYRGVADLSSCCRPGGSFFRLAGATAPATAQRAFEGCEAASWQSFLFKVRMTGGAVGGLCGHSEECLFATRYDGDYSAWRARSAGIRPEGCKLGRTLLWLLVGLSESMCGREPAPDAFEVDAAMRILEEVDRDFGLFQAVGVTLSQIWYMVWLLSIDTESVLQKQAELLSMNLSRQSSNILSVTARARSAVPLVIDFGASGGADAEYYLTRHRRVFSVEGNGVFAEVVSQRLRAFADVGLFRSLKAAVGGPNVASRVNLFESEKIEHSGLHRRPGAKRYTNVPFVPCGSVYLEALRWAGDPLGLKGAELVKIDVEGEDVRCLASIFHNCSRVDGLWAPGDKAPGQPRKPLLPRFVSLELRLHERGVPRTNQYHQKRLILLTRGLYCWAKLARQHVFNQRNYANQLGLGTSGPFGDGATDWRSGDKWRPITEVLFELPIASALVRLSSHDWFDLHMRRCTAREAAELTWQDLGVLPENLQDGG